MSIEVSNLTKKYGEQLAVNNIAFSVAKGEIVGFLGPNGAGKSTTMKMITGYIQPTQGSINVCDMMVDDNDLVVKQKIGYLPESNALYYDMYIREYLTFIAQVHKIANPKQVIEDTITKVGLTLEANKKIGQLSKGYKQRVGLAAAILHNPDVLILDEPTSGLDPNQIIEIRNVIKELGKDKTILFSSHILQEVEALCERVIIINKGNIVADDKLSNLRKGQSQNNYIVVQFDKGIDISNLENIAGVSIVENKDNSSFKLKCENNEMVKKAILQFAINSNVNIVSLQTESQSLEAVFKTLTK
jgi:ABC-2 type transport system ATP-binding protein